MLIFFVGFLFFFSEVFGEGIEEAKKYRESGKFDDALAIVSTGGFNGNAEAEKLHAKLLMDKNLYKEALEVYGRVCTLLSSVDCYNEMGVAYFSLGQWEDAEASFQKALDLEYSGIMLSSLAQVKSAMKNLDEAEDLYKKSMKQDSENPLVRMNYAIHLIRTKRISSAKEILEKLLKENSSLFYAEMCLGYAHYLKQEYNTAGIHINRGIKINPDFYDLYYHRALVYYKKGNYFAATQDLNKAEKLNPGLKKISDLRILIKKSSGM